MGTNTKKKVWLIIPAAGIGSRMQADVPKQYLKINNKPILLLTLECFNGHSDIAGVIVALNPDDPYWKNLKVNMDIPLYTVEGGKERSDSVFNALEYLLTVEQLDSDSWVMVHDAARPVLSKQDLNALLALRYKNSIGGLLATPVRDTMKRAKAGTHLVSHTEDRTDLWHALTPQLFYLGQLKSALDYCLEKNIAVTDEASALEAVGETPEIVEGSSHNIKITQPADLKLAKLLLTQDINA